MQSRARLLGHPVHPMLVAIPLGLFAATVLFDLLHLLTGAVTLGLVSYWTMAVGILGALAAAPFGTIGWLAIPAGTRAKRGGLMHGAGNLVVTALFVGSWLLRAPEGPVTGLALFFSFAGALLALFTAWLGAELLVRLGVGIDDHAGLDAPSSLQRPRERPPAAVEGVAARFAPARPPAPGPHSILHSPPAPVDLASESVAGEEDPGAGLDEAMPPRAHAAPLTRPH